MDVLICPLLLKPINGGKHLPVSVNGRLIEAPAWRRDGCPPPKTLFARLWKNPFLSYWYRRWCRNNFTSWIILVLSVLHVLFLNLRFAYKRKIEWVSLIFLGGYKGVKKRMIWWPYFLFWWQNERKREDLNPLGLGARSFNFGGQINYCGKTGNNAPLVQKYRAIISDGIWASLSLSMRDDRPRTSAPHSASVVQPAIGPVCAIMTKDDSSRKEWPVLTLPCIYYWHHFQRELLLLSRPALFFFKRFFTSQFTLLSFSSWQIKSDQISSIVITWSATKIQ